MRYGLGRLDALLFWALLLCMVPLIAFLLLGPLLLIPLHVPLGYNEGWNAYLAARAVGLQGGPLYPPADTLVFNNYPPLSFYLVGLFGCSVTGDAIVAGRIVALASLLASAALLGHCVTLLGGTRRGCLAAALLLLLYATTFFRGYVAVDEPQWLGHALMLSGLAVLLGGRRSEASHPSSGRVATAALLVAAGGFTKHSLVALPIAVTIWLALTSPRTAARWLAAAAGTVAGGLGLVALLHGGDAFADVLLHHRVFQADRALLAVWRMLPLLPLIVVAALGWRRRPPRDRAMQFTGLFVATALAAGVVERTGQGVNYNAYFEAAIALCLAAGLAMSRAGRPGPAALAAFATLPVLLTLPPQLAGGWRDIAGRHLRERAWQPVIARVAATPGAVGCQLLSVCFWAGKPYAVDMFNLNQSILTGGPIERFDALARRHAFGLFEYDRKPFHGLVPGPAAAGDRLLQDLLRRGYVPTTTDPDGNVLLVPNGTAAASQPVARS